MKFWFDGKQYDVASVQDSIKAKLLESVEADWLALIDLCQSFGRATDLNAWALEHFGRDGQWKLYNDRSYVETMLAGKVIDLWESERVIALGRMGLVPSFKNSCIAAQQAKAALSGK